MTRATNTPRQVDIRSRWIFYIKLGATVLLLLVLLFRADFSQLIHAVRQFRAETWLINLCLFFAAFMIASSKWKLLLPEHKFVALLKLNFIGQYYSMLLPGQFAGEIVKAYRLGRGKPNAEQIAASVIIDRITGIIGLLVVAMGGAICERNTIDRRIIWFGIICAVVLLAGICCLKFPWRWSLLPFMPARFEWLGAPVRRLVAAGKRYLNQPGLLLLGIALGACYQLVAIWINFRFGRELGVGLRFVDWCWVFGVISLVTMLPFTVAGIGLREGSFVGTLTLFAVPSEKSLALSFAIFTLLLSGAAVGAVLEWSNHSKVARL